MDTMNLKDLTIEELQDYIQEIVEEKLKELLGDPDWGIELREETKKRLQHSVEAVQKGEKGRSLLL